MVVVDALEEHGVCAIPSASDRESGLVERGKLPVEPVPRRSGAWSWGGVVSCSTLLSGLRATMDGLQGERGSLRDAESSSESAMTWRGAMVPLSHYSGYNCIQRGVASRRVRDRQRGSFTRDHVKMTKTLGVLRRVNPPHNCIHQSYILWRKMV